MPPQKTGASESGVAQRMRSGSSVGLAERKKERTMAARQAVSADSGLTEGVPGAAALAGGCFCARRPRGLGVAMSGMVVHEDFHVDSDTLAYDARRLLLDLGGEALAPPNPGVPHLDFIGHPFPHAVLDPGGGEVSHPWMFSSPRGRALTDGPLTSTVVTGCFVSRVRCEGSPVIGLAHLWLRLLPSSYILRMACVSMRWAEARDVLLFRRFDLEDWQRYGLGEGGEEGEGEAEDEERADTDGAWLGDEDPGERQLDLWDRPAGDFGLDAAAYVGLLTGRQSSYTSKGGAARPDR